MGRSEGGGEGRGPGVKRRTLLIAACILMPLAGCFAHDLSVPPSREITTHVARRVILFYRANGSSLTRRVVQCRFTPTCSAYGLAAVEKYGGLRGGMKALGRIARCNPFTPAGTVDRPRNRP